MKREETRGEDPVVNETTLICPIYSRSRVGLAWFTRKYSMWVVHLLVVILVSSPHQHKLADCVSSVSTSTFNDRIIEVTCLFNTNATWAIFLIQIIIELKKKLNQRLSDLPKITRQAKLIFSLYLNYFIS